MAENTPNNTSTIRQRIQNQQDINAGKEQRKVYKSNTENLRQYALTEERVARAGDDDVRNLSSEITPPGWYRYYVGFGLAIIGDISDVVNVILILAFGAGIPIGWVIDIIINIPLLFLGFKSSKELKKTGSAASAITEKIQNLEQKIFLYRQRYATVLRMSRKVSVLRKPVRQVAKKFKAVRKIITKSPVGRLVVYFVADLVPILDLIPFRTIAMWQVHKQEKLAYQEFQLLVAEDYTEARAEEEEANSELLAAEQEDQAEEFQDNIN